MSTQKPAPRCLQHLYLQLLKHENNQDVLQQVNKQTVVHPNNGIYFHS